MRTGSLLPSHENSTEEPGRRPAGGQQLILALPINIGRAPWNLMSYSDQPRAATARAPRVFILDDETDHREQVASLLRDEGCEIVGMCDSEFSAAAWLTRNPASWELAVIDLALEQGSGMNSVLRFVNARSHGAVVIYTTYVSESVRETGRLLGASATISKRDPEELRRFIRTLTRPGSPG